MADKLQDIIISFINSKLAPASITKIRNDSEYIYEERVWWKVIACNLEIMDFNAKNCDYIFNYKLQHELDFVDVKDLIIKLLPLAVFNDTKIYIKYGDQYKGMYLWKHCMNWIVHMDHLQSIKKQKNAMFGIVTDIKKSKCNKIVQG